MMKIQRLLTLVILFLPVTSFSQPIGNGADGSPSISGVVNAYTPLINLNLACREEIEVGDASLFSIGDLVLIIQMQGAQIDGGDSSSYGTILNYGNAGNYEYSKVAALTGKYILKLQHPLQLSYDTAGKVQVIRVPQYINPVITGTLTCKPWDGSTGGILAIDATGNILLQAAIDVSKRGFQGGQVYAGPEAITDTAFISLAPSLYADGTKGEGIAFNGIPPYTDAKGAPANGGGGGDSHTAGGGGGGNYGCGGTGGWGYPLTSYYKLSQGLGGHPLIYSTGQNKIFMGGGGGAGSSHAGQGTSGGNGGGIIIITANMLIANGNTINAYGDSSLSGGGLDHADGIGGGGAGGTVLLAMNSIKDTVPLNIYGGNGGGPSLLGAGPGGGGGGGLCWLSFPSLSGNISVDTLGGIGGNIKGNNYGAANGCTGSVLSGLAISLSAPIPSVKAAFATSPSNTIGTSIITVNNSSNAFYYQWNFGDGTTDSTINPTHNYLTPGIYGITLVATDTMNCSDSTSQVIITDITNVFTPNEDGKNDSFAFPDFDKEIYSVKFEIYNRWGILVFNSSDENNKWDGTINGKKASEGTYYYIIEINNKINGIKMIKKGSVTLLR